MHGWRARRPSLAGAAQTARRCRARAWRTCCYSVIEPGDRVCLEGNNQKQADFLAQGAGRARSRPASTTCTCCNRCWPCPSISMCSNGAWPTAWTFHFRGRSRDGSPNWSPPASSISAPSTPTSSCSPAISSTWRRACAWWRPKRPTATATCTRGRTPRTPRPSSRPPLLKTESSSCR